MDLVLDDQIYRWLLSLSILSSSDVKHLKNSKHQVIANITNSFENGSTICLLLQKLSESKSKLFDVKLLNCPSSRLANWNTIKDFLKNEKFDIDNDLIKLILDGDIPMINEFLKDLFRFFGARKKKINQPESLISNIFSSKKKNNDSSSLDLVKNGNASNLDKGPKKNESNFIEISVLNERACSDSGNLLEFLVLMLAGKVNLKAHQAAALFTKNSKYLAHVLAKGVNGEYSQIISFFDELISQKETLIKLISKNPSENVTFLLQTLKPALISRHPSATSACLSFFLLLSSSFNLPSFTFLTDPSTLALQTLYLALKRHPQLAEQIFVLMNSMSSYDKKNFWRSKLNELLPKEEDFLFVLRALGELNIFKQIAEIKALEGWRGFAMEKLKGEVNGRNFGLIFLIDSLFYHFDEKVLERVCEFFPNFIDEKFSASNEVVIYNFCKLLKFQNVKIPYSALSLALNANVEKVAVREAILLNLGGMLEDVNEELLIGEIVEPLLKKINKSFQWNVFDFMFFAKIARLGKSPKLIGNLLLETFSKLYLISHVWAPLAGKILFEFLSKVFDERIYQDLTYKFCKWALSLYVNLSKKSKSRNADLIKEEDQNKPRYKRRKTNVDRTVALNELTPNEIKALDEQRKKTIIDLIKIIFELNNDPFNLKLKELVGHMILQMKKYINKKPNQGLMDLLSIWGPANKLIVQIENDYYEKMENNRKKKNEEKEKNLKLALESETISIISGSETNLLTDNLSLDLDFDQSEIKNKKPPKFSKVLTQQVISISNKHDPSKEDQPNLALHRSPVINPELKRKLKSLEDEIKEKKQKEAELLLNNEMKEKARKIKLRKQIEKISLKKGIAPTLANNVESKLIYPLDSERENTKKELIRLEDEEEIQQHLIKLVWENNFKFLKYFFLKYANSSYRMRRPEYFDQVGEYTEKMNSSETIRMMKENNLLVYFDKFYSDKVLEMIKEINLKFFPNNKEIDSLDFDGFKTLLLQLAALIQEREKSLQYFEISQAFENLIKLIRDNPINELVKNLFKEDKIEKIEKIANVHDLENNEFQENKEEFVIPEGYMKSTEQKVEWDHRLPDGLIIPEGFSISYGIINDLLFANLQINMIEPLSNKVTVPILKRKNHFNHTNSLSQPNSIPNKSASDSKIEGFQKNKLLLLKEQKLAEEAKLKEQKEKKRMKRKQLINKILVDNSPAKDGSIVHKELIKKREINMNLKSTAVQEQMKENEKKQKFWERQRKIMEERRSEQVRMRKEEEEKREKEALSEKQKKENEKEMKKKHFENFNQQQIEKMVKKFDKVLVERKEKAISVEKSKSNIKDVSDKIFEQVKKEDYQIRVKKEENHNLLMEVYTSEKIQLFFNKHLSTLQAIFNFLLSYTFTPINIHGGRDTVPLNTILTFANQFNICPLLFGFKDIIIIYKSLLRNDLHTKDNIVIGMNFDQFKECFFRFAVKANSKLNKISEYIQISNNSTNYQDLIGGEESANKNEFISDESIIKHIKKRNKNLIDFYFDIEKTNYLTLEAFLHYLGLPLNPKDKQAVENRFKVVINEKKVKPTKYRKMELNKKLEGEGY